MGINWRTVADELSSRRFWDDVSSDLVEKWYSKPSIATVIRGLGTDLSELYTGLVHGKREQISPMSEGFVFSPEYLDIDLFTGTLYEATGQPYIVNPKEVSLSLPSAWRTKLIHKRIPTGSAELIFASQLSIMNEYAGSMMYEWGIPTHRLFRKYFKSTTPEANGILQNAIAAWQRATIGYSPEEHKRILDEGSIARLPYRYEHVSFELAADYCRQVSLPFPKGASLDILLVAYRPSESTKVKDLEFAVHRDKGLPASPTLSLLPTASLVNPDVLENAQKAGRYKVG